MSVVRGRPPGLGRGIIGSIRRYWSSLSAWPAPKSPTNTRSAGLHILVSRKDRSSSPTATSGGGAHFTRSQPPFQNGLLSCFQPAKYAAMTDQIERLPEVFALTGLVTFLPSRSPAEAWQADPTGGRLPRPCPTQGHHEPHDKRWPLKPDLGRAFLGVGEHVHQEEECDQGQAYEQPSAAQWSRRQLRRCRPTHRFA